MIAPLPLVLHFSITCERSDTVGDSDTAQRQVHVESFAQGKHHLRREQRMSTQFEEVVQHSHSFEFQHLRPNRCHRFFGRRPRCYELGGQLVSIQLRRRQPLCDRLSRWRSAETPRAAQTHSESCIQATAASETHACRSTSPSAFLRYDISDDSPITGSVFIRGDYALPNNRMSFHLRFDLTQLDTETTDLYLVIDAG